MDNNAPLIRFVYFDLDDTLVDTTTVVLAAYDEGRAELTSKLTAAGLMPPSADIESELLRFFGSALPEEYFRAWLAEAGARDGAALTWAGDAAAAYRRRLAAIPPFPAAIPTLEWLTARGIGRGIITDGRADRQREKLRHAGLAPYFGPVFISEDYPIFKGKPGRMMFDDALAAAGCPAGQTMFVGDRTKDVAGANLAGMVSVRILQGWENRKPAPETFRAARAAYVIPDLGELPAIIAARGSG